MKLLTFEQLMANEKGEKYIMKIHDMMIDIGREGTSFDSLEFEDTLNFLMETLAYELRYEWANVCLQLIWEGEDYQPSPSLSYQKFLELKNKQIFVGITFWQEDYFPVKIEDLETDTKEQRLRVIYDWVTETILPLAIEVTKKFKNI